MKSQRFSKYPRITPAAQDRVPWKKIFWGAWNIFAFSAAFAVLFNAFYADGIELKYKPKKTHLGVVYSSAAVPTYPGLGSGNPAPLPNNPAPAIMPNQGDSFPRLSLIGAKDRFDKKTCIFLDARKPEEYQAGHIPGALNFYGNEPDRYAPIVMPQLFNKNWEIITYCHGGDCDLSLQVAKTLSEAGYSRVEIFEGGWPEWKNAGYPISTGDTPGEIPVQVKHHPLTVDETLNDRVLCALSLLMILVWVSAKKEFMKFPRLHPETAASTLLRLACGFLLAGASLDKLGDAAGFSDFMKECYYFTPDTLRPLAAVVIPWLEFFTGLCLKPFDDDVPRILLAGIEGDGPRCGGVPDTGLVAQAILQFAEEVARFRVVVAQRFGIQREEKRVIEAKARG